MLPTFSAAVARLVGVFLSYLQLSCLAQLCCNHPLRQGEGCALLVVVSSPFLGSVGQPFFQASAPFSKRIVFFLAFLFYLVASLTICLFRSGQLNGNDPNHLDPVVIKSDALVQRQHEPLINLSELALSPCPVRYPIRPPIFSPPHRFFKTACFPANVLLHQNYITTNGRVQLHG